MLFLYLRHQSPEAVEIEVSDGLERLSSLLSAISPGGGPSASISALIRSEMALLRMVTRHASLGLPRDVIGWICTSSESPVPILKRATP